MADLMAMLAQATVRQTAVSDHARLAIDAAVPVVVEGVELTQIVPDHIPGRDGRVIALEFVPAHSELFASRQFGGRDDMDHPSGDYAWTASDPRGRCFNARPAVIANMVDPASSGVAAD